ncbi:MAG: hypothetical protein ACYTG0_35160 [Planctomycetota bacterium]|jgi:hypothetical protein
MDGTLAILGCFLFAQAGGDLPTSETDAPLWTGGAAASEDASSPDLLDQGASGAELTAPGDTTPPGVARRPSPRDMVARALTPAGAAAGRPLTLLEAMSSASDGRRQLDVTHAYWRLTAAVADHHLYCEEYDRLEQLEARPDDAAMLQTAQAAAAAALRMAEVDVLKARHGLIEAAGLSPSEPLPSPADLPHVGTYRTYFDEVFAMRNPPPQAERIHRNLPIHRQAIDARAAAVQAADDAWIATVDAYRERTAGLAHVLSSLGRWGGQYRALVASVCDYNHAIADYALSVAGPQRDKRVVVGMLIRSQQSMARSPGVGRTAEAGVGERSSRVQQATLNAPLSRSQGSDLDNAPLWRGTPRDDKKTPTVAPPRDLGNPPEPHRADPPEPSEPAGEPSGPTAPSTEEPPSTATLPDEAPPLAEQQRSDPGVIPLESLPHVPATRTARRPPVDLHAIDQTAAGLYAALVEAEPLARAQHLTAALHWNRALSDAGGEPIELGRCLAGVAPSERRGAIDAYWSAAQRAAEYQALAGRVDFLEQLVPVALDQRGQPFGAEAMLEVRAARLAAQADLLVAKLTLRNAQHQLSRRLGRPSSEPALLPITEPHSGPFDVDASGGPPVNLPPAPRLTSLIPGLADVVVDRATAVVGADASRASATSAYLAGTQPVDRVLASIQQQHDQTLAFLDTLTQYNQAIADYALAVTPSTLSGNQLAEMLVAPQ